MLSYSFSFSNQTDQRDETEGLQRERLEMDRYERDISKREGVNRLFIVYAKPNCAAGFALLNLPKGKSLGRSKPETNSSNEQAHATHCVGFLLYPSPVELPYEIK